MFSIIIPAHNEGQNIAPLLHEIKEVMTLQKMPWEVVVVDDQSTDDTWEQLEKLEGLPLQAFKLKVRSGQSAALQVGFREAKGDFFITLDGDGQNDPHDIPRLIEGLAFFDCVCGYRKERHDRWQKRIISKMANSVRRMVLGDDIIDTGCSLKAFKRGCIDHVWFFKGAHRFLASLILFGGFSLKQIAVEHRPRTKGKSHYSIFNRGFSTVTDLFAVRWMKKRYIAPQIEATLSHDS